MYLCVVIFNQRRPPKKRARIKRERQRESGKMCVRYYFTSHYCDAFVFFALFLGGLKLFFFSPWAREGELQSSRRRVDVTRCVDVLMC